MKEHWKPILALLIFSPILTELLSTNMPASQLFTFKNMLLLSTLGYGFPLLVIREASIRSGFGLFGLLALGMLYSLYNEALIAKTLFSPFHSPLPLFADYGLAGKLRVPWMLMIGTWHAFHSVLYPIVFIHYLFPNSSAKPWVGKRTAWVIGVFCILVGVLAFFTGEEKGEFAYFLVSAALMWLFFELSKRVSKDPRIIPGGIFGFKPILYGAGIYAIFFLAPAVINGIKAPAIIFNAYFMAIIACMCLYIYKQKGISLTSMVLFAIGNEITYNLFIILFNEPGGINEKLIAAVIFIAIFTGAAFTIWKRKKDRPGLA